LPGNGIPLPGNGIPLPGNGIPLPGNSISFRGRARKRYTFVVRTCGNLRGSQIRFRMCSVLRPSRHTFVLRLCGNLRGSQIRIRMCSGSHPRDRNQQQRVLLVLLALVLALRANAEKLFSPLFAALAGFLGLFGKGGVIWSYKLVISRAGVLVVAQHGLEEV
jgi:hypothetical protein